jgi:hypothetical protein
MATQIVMDHSGDTRHRFDAKDVKALTDAERRFKVLTGSRLYGCGSECKRRSVAHPNFRSQCKGNGVLSPIGRRLIDRWRSG